MHIPVIGKFKKLKVYCSFKDNIWGADLADMQLRSKYSKEVQFLLYVIDILSKYVWVVLLEDKKVITITNAFQKNLDKFEGHEANIPGCEPNKIWADRGS